MLINISNSSVQHFTKTNVSNVYELLETNKSNAPTRRKVKTYDGTVITYISGSAYKHLTGKASKGTLKEKFLDRTTKTDTCWLWKGSTDPDGYGRFSLGVQENGKPKTMFAHRWSYEHFVGPIPDGYVIDHLAEVCSHRNCVNPEHLEPTTGGDNVSRGWAAKRAKVTHCVNLHEYAVVGRSPDNTCKQCNRDASKKYREENLELSRAMHAKAEAARRERKRDEINERRRNRSPEEKERINALRRVKRHEI